MKDIIISFVLIIFNFYNVKVYNFKVIVVKCIFECLFDEEVGKWFIVRI
jgi:hypothetical protein